MSSVKHLETKPPRLTIHPANIPRELRDIPNRWAVWSWKQRGKKWDKPPQQLSGKAAANNNPKHWGTFEPAYDAVASGKFDGLGFTLGQRGCGFIVVDIDDCRCPLLGDINPQATAVIELLDSYCETSPSGEGVKIWLRGEMPEGEWAKQKNGFECYSNGRYLTVTGHAMEGFGKIADAGAQLLEFLTEHMQLEQPSATTKPAAKTTSEKADWTTHCAELALEHIDPDCDYGDWLKVGMAMHSHSPELFAAWNEWSSTGGKYEGERKCKQHWQSFGDKASGVTIATLFWMAKQSGFVMPDNPTERTKAAKADPRDVAEQIIDANRHPDGSGRIRWHGGKMLLWSDGRYVAQGKQADSAFVTNAMAERYTFIGQNHASNVVNHMRALTILPTDTKQPSWLDSNPWRVEDCFATRDSIIHLPSFVDGGGNYRIGATPSYFSTVATEYGWQDDSPGCPVWLEFLSQLWPDDDQSIETLQMWFGYCLTADVSQHKALFLIGPKRSGKGTICSVAEHLIGVGNTSAPTVAALAKDFGLESSLGKSLAIVADARLSKRADQAAIVETILSVTANDKIDVNQKGIKAESTRMPIKLVMCSNEMPRLADASGVIASRLLILRMTKSFYDVEDTQLFAKLQGELTGILHWAIAGWAKLRERRKFTQPDSGRAMQKQIAELASPVASFVGLHCELGDSTKVETELLYANWRVYCDRTGHQAGSDATFGRDLMAAYPTIERRQLRADGRRPYFYCGIALQHATLPDFDEIPVLEHCL